MKRFEHALIILTWCLILMAILFLSLNKLAEPRQKEQQRRFEMTTKIYDDYGK